MRSKTDLKVHSTVSLQIIVLVMMPFWTNKNAREANILFSRAGRGTTTNHKSYYIKGWGVKAFPISIMPALNGNAHKIENFKKKKKPYFFNLYTQKCFYDSICVRQKKHIYTLTKGLLMFLYRKEVIPKTKIMLVLNLMTSSLPCIQSKILH